MKAAATVLFVIAMLVSSTQTFRHVYVKWIAPSTSVLDEFKDKGELEIESAKTLDELVELYRESKQRIKEYAADETNPKITYRYDDRGRGYDERQIKEPYKSEYRIRREINNREQDLNRLFKLKFYWGAGLISSLLGLFVARKVNAWLGFSAIVGGISEMLCWTSPLFHNRISSQQFDDLLIYKLLFSLITWAMLIVLWLLVDKRNVLEKNG